jgi:hypothetical protein
MSEYGSPLTSELRSATFPSPRPGLPTIVNVLPTKSCQRFRTKLVPVFVPPFGNWNDVLHLSSYPARRPPARTKTGKLSRSRTKRTRLGHPNASPRCPAAPDDRPLVPPAARTPGCIIWPPASRGQSFMLAKNPRGKRKSRIRSVNAPSQGW